MVYSNSVHTLIWLLCVLSLIKSITVSSSSFFHAMYLLKKLVHLSYRTSCILDLVDCIMMELFKCSSIACVFCQLLFRAWGSVRYIYIYICKNMSQVVVLLLRISRLIRRVRGRSLVLHFKFPERPFFTPPYSSQVTWCFYYSPTFMHFLTVPPARISSLPLVHIFLRMGASIKSHLILEALLHPL